MDYQLTRGFRLPDERSFTDHHLVELGIRHVQAQVKLFGIHQESKTGADWEWWIGDSSEGFIGLLVQAKKVNYAGRYAGLAQTIGSQQGAPRQIDRLIEVCATGTAHLGAAGTDDFIGLEPVYVLYNGTAPAGATPANDRCQNPIRDQLARGCTLARADEVKAILDGAPATIQNGRDAIAPATWPWACLFCCPSVFGRGLARRLASVLAGSPADDGWRPGDPEGSDAPRIWSWDQLPEYVQLMANRDVPGEVDQSVARQRPGAARVAVFNDPPLEVDGKTSMSETQEVQ